MINAKTTIQLIAHLTDRRDAVPLPLLIPPSSNARKWTLAKTSISTLPTRLRFPEMHSGVVGDPGWREGIYQSRLPTSPPRVHPSPPISFRYAVLLGNRGGDTDHSHDACSCVTLTVLDDALGARMMARREVAPRRTCHCHSLVAGRQHLRSATLSHSWHGPVAVWSVSSEYAVASVPHHTTPLPPVVFLFRI